MEEFGGRNILVQDGASLLPLGKLLSEEVKRREEHGVLGSPRERPREAWGDRDVRHLQPRAPWDRSPAQASGEGQRPGAGRTQLALPESPPPPPRRPAPRRHMRTSPA